MKLRHITLLIGSVAIILSFLFFASKNKLYIILLFGGVVLTGISFLIILFQDNKRGKIIWLFIVIILVIIQNLSERLLIKQSFKSVFNKNELLLISVNKILLSNDTTDIFITKNSLKTDGVFSQNEFDSINTLFNYSPVVLINKNNTRIYYELFGFLDARAGISYYLKDPPDPKYRIRERWYY